MAILTIEPINQRTAHSPGETLAGSVAWQLEKPATALELRLFFYTRGRGNMRGKGRPDTRIVQTARFEHPALSERRPFSFELPEGPYSFAGKLISLMWALELVVIPNKETQRLELIIAPGGKEIVLPTTGS